MRQSIGSAVIVSSAPGADQWFTDIEVIPDVRADCGTLGGLYAAIVAGDDPVFVTAWDMPFVSVDLIDALKDALNDWDAILPESPGPSGIEPLCGIYTRACENAIIRSLEEEDFRAIGFHESVRVGRLPLDVVQRFGDPATLFFNVNTVDDLAQAEELWREQPG